MLFLKAVIIGGFGEIKTRLCSVVALGVTKIMDIRKTDLNLKCENVGFRESGNVAAASCQPALAASKAFGHESA